MTEGSRSDRLAILCCPLPSPAAGTFGRKPTLRPHRTREQICGSGSRGLMRRSHCYAIRRREGSRPALVQVAGEWFLNGRAMNRLRDSRNRRESQPQWRAQFPPASPTLYRVPRARTRWQRQMGHPSDQGFRRCESEPQGCQDNAALAATSMRAALFPGNFHISKICVIFLNSEIVSGLAITWDLAESATVRAPNEIPRSYEGQPDSSQESRIDRRFSRSVAFSRRSEGPISS